MRSVARWTGRAPRRGPALVCRECHHYHTRAPFFPSGICGEQLGSGTLCLCKSEDRLSVDEADKLGLGWP